MLEPIGPIIRRPGPSRPRKFPDAEMGVWFLSPSVEVVALLVLNSQFLLLFFFSFVSDLSP